MIVFVFHNPALRLTSDYYALWERVAKAYVVPKRT